MSDAPETKRPAFAVLYIMGVNRSGSTVLDRLLGQQEGCLSLGEMRRLNLYARRDLELPKNPNKEDQYLCSCGQPVLQCPFWQQVAQKTGFDLHTIPTRSDRLNLLWRRLVQGAWRFAGPSAYQCLASFLPAINAEVQVGRNCWQLYEAAASISGARLLIDSSKNPYHFTQLWVTATAPLYLLILQRDGRAVTYSMARGKRAEWFDPKDGPPFAQAVKIWVRGENSVRYFASQIPAANKMVLGYEDLCRNPLTALQRIFKLVKDERPRYETLLGNETFHNIGGSPSRLEKSRREIRLDESWRTNLEPEHLATFTRLGGPTNRRLGYDA